jgi:hypothetical protein
MTRGGAAPHSRRGAAHRGQHRQAAEPTDRWLRQGPPGKRTHGHGNGLAAGVLRPA